MLVELNTRTRRERETEMKSAVPIHSDDQDLCLIRRIAAGDEDAMRLRYAVHGQHLYAYALKLTNDPGQAEQA